MTGNLHSDYERIGGLLDFPACSSTQWSRIVKRLEEFVSDLAEWSCSRVRNKVKERGDDKEWITSFDGVLSDSGPVFQQLLSHSSMTLGSWLGLRSGQNVVQAIIGLEHRSEQRLMCWMSWQSKRGGVYSEGAHL